MDLSALIRVCTQHILSVYFLFSNLMSISQSKSRHSNAVAMLTLDSSLLLELSSATAIEVLRSALLRCADAYFRLEYFEEAERQVFIIDSSDWLFYATYQECSLITFATKFLFKF